MSLNTLSKAQAKTENEREELEVGVKGTESFYSFLASPSLDECSIKNIVVAVSMEKTRL